MEQATTGNVIGEDYIINLNRQISMDLFTVLYMGQQISTGETVAIRRGESTGRYNVYSEKSIDVTLALDHPNIVKVRAIIREGGYVYAIEEYCGGEALNKLLVRAGESRAKRASNERGPELCEYLIIKLVLQLASAMDHIHSKRTRSVIQTASTRI